MATISEFTHDHISSQPEKENPSTGAPPAGATRALRRSPTPYAATPQGQIDGSAPPVQQLDVAASYRPPVQQLDADAAPPGKIDSSVPTVPQLDAAASS